jgi:hypothetical protein
MDDMPACHFWSFMTVLIPVEVINVGDGLLHHLHLKADNGQPRDRHQQTIEEYK